MCLETVDGAYSVGHNGISQSRKINETVPKCNNWFEVKETQNKAVKKIKKSGAE